MINKSNESASTSVSRNQPRFASNLIILMIMWLVSTVTIVILLFQGVRDTDQFQIIRYVLQAAYVLTLIWHISRTGPSTSKLPDIQPLIFPKWQFGKLIPVLTIALLLAFISFSDSGFSILILLLMIASVLILAIWHREIRLRMVLLGLGIAIVAFLGGLPYLNNGFITQSGFIIFLSFIPLMFISGGLLIKRSNLGGIQLLTGRYGKAFRSLLWGFLLFVPLGLFNTADGAPGTDMNWMTHWWMPFSLPWYSGIFEETWFRLLLVGISYFVLRPAFSRHPALAVLIAVLFTSITFGLGHDRTIVRLLTTGLLYGLPMAVVFVFRDWEHAVGAHYMINMIPTMSVFLEN